MERNGDHLRIALAVETGLLIALALTVVQIHSEADALGREFGRCNRAYWDLHNVALDYQDRLVTLGEIVPPDYEKRLAPVKMWDGTQYVEWWQ